MFNHKFLRPSLKEMLVFCIFLIFWGNLLAQQQQALSLEQIVTLLKSVPQQQAIIEQVNRFKVAFKLTDWKNAAQLVRSGATDQLLEAIERNYFDILQVKFGGWWPYGGINITTAEDGSYFIANGNMSGFSGYTTPSSFNIGNKRILKVRVEASANSFFVLYHRMLKVIAGANQHALLCTDAAVHSQDVEFVIRIDSTFEYRIPETMVSQGVLQGLGFVFGPGNINNLKLSAWFE